MTNQVSQLRLEQVHKEHTHGYPMRIFVLADGDESFENLPRLPFGPDRSFHESVGAMIEVTSQRRQTRITRNAQTTA